MQVVMQMLMWQALADEKVKQRDVVGAGVMM